MFGKICGKYCWYEIFAVWKRNLLAVFMICNLKTHLFPCYKNVILLKMQSRTAIFLHLHLNCSCHSKWSYVVSFTIFYYVGPPFGEGRGMQKLNYFLFRLTEEISPSVSFLSLLIGILRLKRWLYIYGKLRESIFFFFNLLWGFNTVKL